jgi:hypothetical protein
LQRILAMHAYSNYICYSAVSVFRAWPVVVSRGSDFVVVSVTNALKNMYPNDKKHFVRGELHLLQVQIICV